MVKNLFFFPFVPILTLLMSHFNLLIKLMICRFTQVLKGLPIGYNSFQFGEAEKALH